MSFTTVFYEGDSVIRFAPRVRAAVNTPGHGTKTQRVAQPPHSLGKRRTRRGATEVLIGAIWNALRCVALWWIEKTSRDAHYRRIESYLAQSTDHADLERRLRDLERGNRSNWIDYGSR